MRKNTTLTFIAVLLLFLEGCKIDSVTEPIIIAEVEDEFYLDLWEILTPGERQLELRFHTLSNEPCSNFKIGTSFYRNGSAIQISLREIIQPSDCTPGEAPARAAINFGALPEGFYFISIDLKETIVNKGQLTVRPESYTIHLQSNKGIRFRQKELRRIPHSTIWGYVVYPDAVNKPEAELFIKDLEGMTAPSNLQDGDYGYFAKEGQTIKVFQQSETALHQSFAFRFEGERSQLERLLSEYRNGYQGKLTIRLFDSTGKEY